MSPPARVSLTRRLRLSTMATMNDWIHLHQVFQEVESSGQNLLIKKIAEEGAVAFALFGHGRPYKLIAKYYNELCALVINLSCNFKVNLRSILQQSRFMEKLSNEERKNMQLASVITNGCPENRIDGARIQEFLKENGWTLSNDINNCDLILFNTCALTEYYQESSIIFIKQLNKIKKFSARLIVCGCLPKINSSRLHDVYTGPTFGSDIYSLSEILEIPKIAYKTIANHLIPLTETSPGIEYKLNNKLSVLSSYFLNFQQFYKEYIRLAEQFNIIGPNHFYIKVATGCLSHCSYCAVKISRGILRSKGIDEILGEFYRGLEQGYKHFSLLGTDLGCYGRERGTTLVGLLKEMVRTKGNYGIKLRNVHPRFLIEMLPQLIEVLNSGKIDFLMSAAQSGNNRILTLMRRQYRIEEYKNAIIRLKGEFPFLTIRTQLMVGFPSETEKEFEDTLRLIDEVDFKFAEIYPFSPRPGTDAATLPGQIPDRIIRKRRLLMIKKILTKITPKAFPIIPVPGRP